ncbi:hypothetical protein [Arthrobacter sp. 92]|uniref:hypothetical protein n=1 Tax=Arthrobacter sp. 92 TaxID=3418175 RepID=UPI003D03BF60
MSTYGQPAPGCTSPSIFDTFRRWPLVPSTELFRLQAALTQCVELVGSDTARELLTLVTQELQQRTAEENPVARIPAPSRPPDRGHQQPLRHGFSSTPGRWPHP